MRTRQRQAMLGRQLRVLGVRIDVGSWYWFPGWPCPAVPSWAFDPAGWELAAQLGFSRDEETGHHLGDTVFGGGLLAWTAAGMSDGG